jgi:hypothetical protein
MNALKTKSLETIEERMSDLDKDSLRYHVLESAKQFKISWIELGRSLYTVWKEKKYREWGYAEFDSYTAREIGIRKQTALKLLRSYYFLEKEEPMYLEADYAESARPASLPSYETINILRLAKDKRNLDKQDYESLKKSVFEKAKDASQLKKDLTALIRQRQELEPEEARQRKKESHVKRLIGVLKTLKNEIEDSKTLPHTLIKDISNLIAKLESQIT